MTKLSSSEINKTTSIWFITIFISALLFSLTPYWPIKKDLQLPLVRENFDTLVYWQGAQWWQNRTPPYRGTIYDQEINKQVIHSGSVPFVAEAYPQLAMMYFTVPALFTNDFSTYQALFFIWNAIWLWALLIITRKLLKLLGKENSRLYYLLLPSFLFFTFNRYDIFPACLVIWAILLLLEKKSNWSFVLLGLSFLSKLYPLILLPLFLLYDRQNNNSSLKSLGIFSVTILAPLTLFITWTGWLPSLTPYFIHFGHATQGSLLEVLNSIIPSQNINSLLHYLFTLLQFILPLFISLILMWSKIQKKKIPIQPGQFISLAAAALLLFIIFSNFFSNQWVVWLVPLLILTIPIKHGWFIITYDLINYIRYPIIFAIFTSIVTLPTKTQQDMATISFLIFYYHIIITLQLLILFFIGYGLIQQLRPCFKLNKDALLKIS